MQGLSLLVGLSCLQEAYKQPIGVPFRADVSWHPLDLGFLGNCHFSVLPR